MTDMTHQHEADPATPVHLHLPDPTPWPMVLALGVTLIAAGLVTQIVVSAIGLAVFVVALLMLIRDDIREQRSQEPSP